MHEMRFKNYGSIQSELVESDLTMHSLLQFLIITIIYVILIIIHIKRDERDEISRMKCTHKAAKSMSILCKSIWRHYARCSLE